MGPSSRTTRLRAVVLHATPLSTLHSRCNADLASRPFRSTTTKKVFHGRLWFGNHTLLLLSLSLLLLLCPVHLYVHLQAQLRHWISISVPLFPATKRLLRQDHEAFVLLNMAHVIAPPTLASILGDLCTWATDGWLAWACCVTLLLVFLLIAQGIWQAHMVGRNDISPAGKPILVTGAASGFGLALTRLLTARGCFVIAADVNAAELQRQFDNPQFAGKVLVVPCDITSTGDISRLAEEIKKTNKGLFGVINNAGIAPSPNALVEVSDADVVRTININLLGMYRVSKACWPMLDKWASGVEPKPCIVNVTSCAGLAAGPFLGAYSMSKFGAEAFSDSLRREIHSKGVRVAVVEPMFAATNILRALSDPIAEGPFAAKIHQSVDFVNKLKLMTPEFVAETIAFEVFSSNHRRRQIIAFPLDKYVLV